VAVVANKLITDATSLTAASGDEIPINRSGTDGKITLPLPVAAGGTGETTAPEAVGELIQALTADSAPDNVADYIATYDASADTGKKVLLNTVMREKITAARTYYVRTDGSDSNNGLANTAGGAWLTPQYAYDWIVDNLDLNGFEVTVQLGDGTYQHTGVGDNDGVLECFKGFHGGGGIVFQGNTGDRTAVVLEQLGTNSIGVIIGIGASGTFKLRYLTIRVTAGHSYNAFEQIGPDCFVTLDSVDFDRGDYHVVCDFKSYLRIIGTYTVRSEVSTHLEVRGQSSIEYNATIVAANGAVPTTVNATGAWFVATHNSWFNLVAITLSGTFTGLKAYIATNSVLTAPGETDASVPGDVAAVTETGGIYSTSDVYSQSELHLLPKADGTYNIGSTTLGWNNLYLDTGATINFENGNAVVTHSSGILNVSTGALQVGGTAVSLQGKQTIWVPASDMTPAAANGAAATTRAINTITTEFLAFDTTTSESAYFNVAFPKSWNEGTVTAQVFWTTTGGGAAQTIEFEISGGCFANDAAINVTGIGTAVAHTDTWIADDDVHVTAEGSAITLSNAAVDTVAWFRIVRDVGNDTLAVDAELIGVKLFYTTDAGNDT
jgi:hypothetical protein